MKKYTLKEALEIFGTKAALAKAVGVSRPAISKLKDPLSDRVEPRISAAVARFGLNCKSFGDVPNISAEKEKA